MPLAESPLLIGGFVLGLSVVRAFIISEARTWLAILLFLMYVGGILVTLSYFLALCPNQSVRFTPFLIMPIGIRFLFVGALPNYQITNSFEVCDIYKSYNITSLIVLRIVLFLAMVRVVKMVRRSSGALRALAG